MTGTRWEKFHYQFIEPGLGDEDRRKTMAALRTLAERLPKKDFDRIPSFTTVFAPSANTLGLIDNWFHPAGADINGLRIYLSPRLERMAQARVNSVVAHEFAHAILRHGGDSFPLGSRLPKKTHDQPSEKEADKLIESWGFRRAHEWRK